MLITNATVVTYQKQNQVLKNHSVYIEGNKILDVLPDRQAAIKYPLVEKYNVDGKLVLPGAICAHTHFYGAFSRGMAIPGDAPANFYEILQKLWWPLDRSLTEKDVEYSALLCLVDAIKHGTTTLFDHHASPRFIDGSLDLLAQSVNRAGLKAGLCYELTDRNGKSERDAGFAENLRFISAQQAVPDSNIVALFGLHAPLTLEPDTLQKLAEADDGTFGFHIHVAEGKDDQAYTQATFKKDPVPLMKEFGIISERSILAHCVNISDEDIDILAKSGVWVTHQPRSNMNNAVGVAKVEKMLQRGVNLALGNDGFSNSMWDEMKTAYLLHKIANSDPRAMNGYTLMEMAATINARMASQFFRMPIGEVQPGNSADLMVVDYRPPTELNQYNFPWHLLFGFRESMIESTISNGEFVMKERQLLTLDEKEIAAKCVELSGGVWDRYNNLF